jgi:hypothetical protein
MIRRAAAIAAVWATVGSSLAVGAEMAATEGATFSADCFALPEGFRTESWRRSLGVQVRGGWDDVFVLREPWKRDFIDPLETGVDPGLPIDPDYRMATNFRELMEQEAKTGRRRRSTTGSASPAIARGSVVEPSVVHPTPEPSTLVLATLASLGLVALRRIQKPR